MARSPPPTRRTGCASSGCVSRGVVARRGALLVVAGLDDVVLPAVLATTVGPTVVPVVEGGSPMRVVGAGAVATAPGATMGLGAPSCIDRFVTLYVIPAVNTTSAAAAIAGRAHVRRTTTVDRFRSSGITGASIRSAMPAHRSREGV